MESKAIAGKLYYRGYDVEDLVKGKQDSHFGYEEICFLCSLATCQRKQNWSISGIS